jgi:hypothetical protein
MAVFFPEVQIYNLISGILEFIKVDYNTNLSTPTKSMLYKLFGGVKIGKFDYFVESKNLFLRGNDYARKIELRHMFDISRAGLPTIHLSLPSESPQFDGIGVDQGYADTQFDEDATDPDHIIQSFTPVYTRAFQTQHNIIISSDNPDEVLLIYNLLKAMMVSVFDSIELAGLRNPKLGAQDLQLNSEVTPANVYFRAITLSSFHELEIPRWFSQQMITNIMAKGTPVMESEVVINPIDPGEIQAAQTIHAGERPARLTNKVGATGFSSYKWQSSPSADDHYFQDIVGAFHEYYQPPVLNYSRWYRRVAIDSEGIYKGVTPAIKITVLDENDHELIEEEENLVDPGTILAPQIINVGGTPNELISGDPPSGSGNVSYQWQEKS